MTNGYNPPPGWVEKASELGLLPRLAGRLGSRGGSLSTMAPVGPCLTAVHRQATVGALRLEQAVRDLTQVADSLGIPAILLKGAALHFLGICAEGSRLFGDIDVLVAADVAPRLREELLAKGWRGEKRLAVDFHLDPVAHPTARIAVEIHSSIPFLEVERGQPVILETLMRQRLVSQVSALGRSVYAPVPQLLLAHAVSHAFVQHWPQRSKQFSFKALSDIIDLETALPAVLESHEEALALAKGFMPVDRFEGVIALARVLACGIPIEAAPLGRPAERLLYHILAGQEGRRNHGFFQARYLRDRLRVAGSLREKVHVVLSLFLLSDQQVRLHLGVDSTALQRALCRVRFFCEQAGKAAAYAWSWLSVVWRGHRDDLSIRWARDPE